jgi:hypothetical protein
MDTTTTTSPTTFRRRKWQEDWLYDLDNIRKEFAKVAWDVTGFQEEYKAMWWWRSNNTTIRNSFADDYDDDDYDQTSSLRNKMHHNSSSRSTTSYEELFAMNEKYMRIIEANLARIQSELKEEDDEPPLHHHHQFIDVDSSGDGADEEEDRRSVKEWMKKHIINAFATPTYYRGQHEEDDDLEHDREYRKSHQK